MIGYVDLRMCSGIDVCSLLESLIESDVEV